MQCQMCGAKSGVKNERITHRFKESGLDNIILTGVEVTHCESCGETLYDFGNLNALHAVIASVLLQKKNNLSGKEMRFLRKFIGFSAANFAHLLKYSPETISRLENSDEVSDHIDRLIRFVVFSKLPERNYDLHDMILSGQGISMEQVRFRRKKDEWLAVFEQPSKSRNKAAL